MRGKLWSMNTGKFGKLLFLMIALSLIAFPFGEAIAGAFSSTGSLLVPRSRHTSTLLPDGKVLIVGGFGINTPSYSSVELYDPSSATYTATGAMGVSRIGCTATLLTNGKVLIAGGHTGNIGSASSAELYDPSTGTFTFTGSMVTARSLHTATLLTNGTVLITGGHNSGINSGLDNAEVYDPITGVSTPTTGGMNLSRYNHTATLLPNGRVLVAGGDRPGGAGWPTELYDPSTKVFTSTGTMHIDRFWHTATLLGNGKVLIIGGIEKAGSNAILKGAELYDSSTGMFTFAANMSIGRTNHAATLLSDGKVLVAGGGAGTFGTQSSAEVFDPATNAFSVTGSMKTTRQSQTATLLANGKVIVAGGETPIPPGPTLTPVSSAELYDPSPDTTPPTVISKTPASGAVGVSISTPITVTFSEAMDASSIVPTAFVLTGGVGSVTCSVIYGGAQATFTPTTNLAYSTSYTATVTTSVKDEAGNPMASNYTWSFTTGNLPDTTPPAVTSTAPANGAVGVSISTPITVTFSEAMDASSIVPAAFVLTSGAGSVTCTASYNSGQAILTPTSNLINNTTYTATLITSVKDEAGNPMASNYTWSFTTGQVSSGGGNGGGGGGCSVSPLRKQDAQSSMGVMFALLSPILVLAIRKTLRRI